MTRGRLFLVVLACVLVAANVRAGWEESLEKAEQKVAAERASKASGMPLAKLKTAYPTPEMVFSDVPVLAPGQSASVLAQGRFQPDTTFLVESDDVEVQNAQLTPKGWKATLRVKPDAWPGEVTVLAIAPVSGIQRSEVALQVSAKYAIEAQLANGWSLKVAPDAGALNDGAYPGKAQWFKPGQKAPFREGPVYVTARGGDVEVGVPPTDEESATHSEDSEKLVEAMQDALPAEQMEALSKKMEACQSLPPERVEKCLAPYVKQMQDLSTAAETKVKKVREGTKSAADEKAFGCRSIRFSRDGALVHGSAEGCGGEDSIDVKSARLTPVK